MSLVRPEQFETKFWFSESRISQDECLISVEMSRLALHKLHPALHTLLERDSSWRRKSLEKRKTAREMNRVLICTDSSISLASSFFLPSLSCSFTTENSRRLVWYYTSRVGGYFLLKKMAFQQSSERNTAANGRDCESRIIHRDCPPERGGSAGTKPPGQPSYIHTGPERISQVLGAAFECGKSFEVLAGPRCPQPRLISSLNFATHNEAQKFFQSFAREKFLRRWITSLNVRVSSERFF